jgi:hypothetical protein
MSAARHTATGHLLSVAAESSAPLSDRFSTDSLYRASASDRPKWSKVTPSPNSYCDECVMRQHETRGQYGPRKSPRHRRHFVGGPALRLCTLHAASWRALDSADIAGKPVAGNPIPPVA